MGIDGSRAGRWTLVRLENGIIDCPEDFSDDPAGLSALMRFIIEECWRPKVCLRLGSGPVSTLLGLVGAIPDVEVVLMSEQGLGLYRSWMPARNPNGGDTAGCALLLALCAERII